MASSSQQIIIDDLDIEDVDNNIHAKGMDFPVFVYTY